MDNEARHRPDESSILIHSKGPPENGKKVRLLALVPHRDARLSLREWSASLFAAGVPGAWSFPWTAPLAQLKHFLSTEELKSLARTLRQYIGEGKFIAGPPDTSSLPLHLNGETASVFGPVLRPELPGDFLSAVNEAVICRIEPLVIGSALMPFHAPLMNDLPAPPQISFRAAALANMIYHEKDGNFFEWKIGPVQWLPKK
ncbi:MAG: hypothetical protein LBG95_03995 [Treponema sp.]|nr:hypothetical protein [Treponema sp.]